MLTALCLFLLLYMLNKDYAFRGATWGKVTSITFSETHYIDGRVKRHVHADMEEDNTPFPESVDHLYCFFP